MLAQDSAQHTKKTAPLEPVRVGDVQGLRRTEVAVGVGDVEVAGFDERHADLERCIPTHVIETELRQTLRYVLDLLAASFELGFGARIAQGASERRRERHPDIDLPAFEVVRGVEILVASIGERRVVENDVDGIVDLALKDDELPGQSFGAGRAADTDPRFARCCARQLGRRIELSISLSVR